MTSIKELKTALKKEMPIRNKRILKKYLGIDGFKKMSYRKIGEEENLSYERVKQIVHGFIKRRKKK